MMMGLGFLGVDPGSAAGRRMLMEGLAISALVHLVPFAFVLTLWYVKWPQLLRATALNKTST
jgi:hypothetical protein